jgi:glycosidase
LYEALVNDNLYPNPMSMVLFEGNHDMPRLYSVLDEDLDLTKMALAYVLTMPRIPQLYYGTEVLMTSPKQRDDGATRQDFPGGWQGDKVNAFTGEGLSDKQKEAQAFVKRLLNWRKHQPVIHNGKLLHYAPENGSYVYFRYLGDKKVMIAFNKNRKAISLDARRFSEMLPAASDGTDIVSGRRIHIGTALDLPARSVMIVELN